MEIVTKNHNVETKVLALSYHLEKSTILEHLQARGAASTRATSRLSQFTLSLIVLSLAIGIGAAATPAMAASPLNSTTPLQLTLPMPCPGSKCGVTTQPVTFFGAIEPTIAFPTTSPDFTGTWVAPAGTPWRGTFTGIGSYPDGIIGHSLWDFTPLNAGSLPAGTFLNFGDLDGGSGTDERFLLQAFDSNLNPIQSAWLNGPSYCSNAPFTATCAQAYLPEYVWGGSNGSTGADGNPVSPWTYEFDGRTVAGNPTLTVWLNTNTPIAYLAVDEFSTFDSVGLAAPTTPEPSSLLLMGSGVLGLGGLLRRRLLG